MKTSGLFNTSPYPYSTLYNHNHYSPNLNVRTAFSLTGLIKASDEYSEMRTLFQNRLRRQIGVGLQPLVTLKDTRYSDFYGTTDPQKPSDWGLTTAQELATALKWVNRNDVAPARPGTRGNAFVGNLPSFTIKGLDYDITIPDDLNSEDRDLFFTLGKVEEGIGEFRNLRYYAIPDGPLIYTTDVSFYWWDVFNFDNDGTSFAQEIAFPDLAASNDIQNAGWGRPYSTSIRIDDTITGIISGPDSTDPYSNFKPFFGPNNGLGNDVVTGTDANDVLLGRRGNDTLVGKAGDDIMSGGKGSDRFVLNGPKKGLDQILDFTSAATSLIDGSYPADKLVISVSSFGGGLTAGVALSASQLSIVSSINLSSGVAAPFQLSHRFIYDQGAGTLWFDGDGSGNRFTTSPIASLTGKPSLSVNDFAIVA